MDRLPLRVRLVVGFAAAMVVVLLGAGAFVFWRVEYALDHRLDEDLAAEASDLRHAAGRRPPAAAIDSLREEGRYTQILQRDGAVLAAGRALDPGKALLTPDEAKEAVTGELSLDRGNLFSPHGRHLRILAAPVPGTPLIAAAAVRLDQRDEALRELLLQLAIANAVALAFASLVGYRLAGAALNPVESYRAQAEQIAAGATGVRLAVPTGHDDEITRLATTLNTMLDAQERAAERQRQFIDDASHELRTPLTTLAAEIDLALRKPRSAEEYEASLHRLATSATRLVELADSLLSLGALGSSAPTAREVNAHDALSAAARRTLSSAVAEAPDGLTVSADPMLLDRALGNLVDNAVRYGAEPITLTARPEPTATVLSVHDAGAGIPADFLEHAAERFRQHDTSRTGRGAGLGLALVDGIITAHQGQLRICANGHHHVLPTATPDLAAIPCRHPTSGTTVTLLFTRQGGAE